MEARIAKERGKRIERTAGYDNDEYALRREFGSDTELDELEAAGGLVDTGGRHGQQEPRREHGPNPGALVHQQKNLFHRTYRARVQTKPVRSLPPVLSDLLSPLCLSSLASGAPGHPTFPPKRPTPSLRPYPLPAPSCCIRPLIFSSTGLLPTLTNCRHPAPLPDLLSPLAT